MNVIVAGSRAIADEEYIYSVIDDVLHSNDIHVKKIISGGANGVDKIAIEYAKERNLSYHVENAQWKHYGKQAGMIRNFEMSKLGDILIAIWDGHSKGTKNMIDICNKNRHARKNILNVFVINPNEKTLF